ncbi:carbohydrate ABC transporter permease [Actinokineospora sp. UTMC 2448]|uniref:carbohydrate ABC transporter permease n=1 Tax=Actinokineospora sp. UTMC 2448 TaxID=2268449 RepID=UPI00216463F2|nr:carbohydrate ABC transporter permease [Actinokineospora sp. UTMC 2448]UVS78177.1 L-arabinose transport system permease protein AraQ [Actinokineospora sp. UTMC 2448]
MTATLTRPTAPPETVRARRDPWLVWVARYSIPIAVAVIFIAPFGFVVLTAFMTSEQALTSDLWPSSWHPENFVDIFTKLPMLDYLLNSMMYALMATGFMLLSSIPAAYALAKLRWRGSRAVFVVVICMMMLPPQVVTVPLYLMWANAGLTGTLWPLIIPMLFGDAFSIFLLRQFLLTIPDDYRDAARIDGCSEWQVLLRVILPLARPAVAAVAIFQFFYAWNDFYGPLLYTSENQESWTLSIALSQFKHLHHVEWNLVMAASLLVMAPVIIMFFFAQKAFIQGVTLTGVKG